MNSNRILTKRIIPARAGFTLAGPDSSFLTWDHPRSRGVYKSKRWGTPINLGSSPLARGLPGGALAAQGGDGIIPARAGFTRTGPARPPGAPDHPRSRGVYFFTDENIDVIPGSSPLARGLHALFGCVGEQGGIIPARAGFTTMPVNADNVLGDHPRSRGVYLRLELVYGWSVGSSPLAGGVRADPLAERPGGRIIPARAGFTPRATPLCRCQGDHPRSRGVYLMPYGAPSAAEGSSPLARGLQWVAGPFLCPAGIIPARAGFTPRSCEPARAPGDHPRSRGVYGVGGDHRSVPRRIIPARAGFTPATP